MIIHRFRRLFVFICAGLFTACSFTNIRSVERAPTFRSDAIHRVLIIGLFKDQELRKVLEQEFVRQWNFHGVQAVSSLEYLPSFSPLNKAGAASLAKAQGFDTVLVTRLVSRKKINAGEREVVHDNGSDIQNVNTTLQVLLAPPDAMNEYDLATVETNLYDVASDRRVWSGTSETKEMQKIPQLIPPFVKLILKRLYESPG